MKKFTPEKIVHEEHKDSHSKSDHHHTATETSPKQHSFATNVSEKLHNMFHTSKHTATTDPSNEHEHSAHEHIHEHVNAPIVETIVKPTIVEETIRHDKVVEIQPIVHRHVEAPEIHHIEQHVYEKLPPVGPSRIVKQPVIEETIQPHITEEVRTVVHREVPAPYVVHEEQHITENLVRPTIHTAEVREELTAKAAPHKDTFEEVHLDDWDKQGIQDNCPLAHETHSFSIAPATTSTHPVSLEKKVVFEEKPLLSGGSRI